MQHDEDGPAPGQAARHVAPGGWRRIVAGFLIGAAVGAAIGLVLPRDDGPVRAPTGG